MSTLTMPRFSSLWWWHLPAAVAKISPSFAAALIDGLYLPERRKSANASGFALVGGFLLGVTHVGFHSAFTESLLLMALLLILATVTRGIAAWAALGLAIGDISASVGQTIIQSNISLQTSLLRLGSLTIVYLLLFALTVFIPQFSERLAASVQLPASLNKQPGVSMGTMVAVGAAASSTLVWIWVHSTPLLIRPVFTWFNQQPTIAVMEPLQQHGTVLIVIAAISYCARFALQRLAPAFHVAPLDLSSIRKTIRESSLRTQQHPTSVRIAARVLLTTFVLSGMLMTWTDTLLIVFVQILCHGIRFNILERIPLLSKTMTFVPLPLRLVIWLLCTYEIAATIVPFYWNSSNTFRPIVLSVACSMIVYSLLFPVMKRRVLPKVGPVW